LGLINCFFSNLGLVTVPYGMQLTFKGCQLGCSDCAEIFSLRDKKQCVT
jgi:hypothetical protein